MAHDLLKIGLTLVIFALVAAAMALLVSGYLSAYKPGGKGVQSPATAVTGSRSLSRAAPSPTPGVNASVFPQRARYTPPVMPGPLMAPPMPMELGMQPPARLPAPSPAMAPPGPSHGVPAVPAAPGINGIIQVLFRLLPLIFSHHFDLTPIWPQTAG